MSKPTILIVDDEPLTRSTMARALAGGYTCLTASDAEDALAKLAEQKDVAVLLTDYKMPGMNGDELIRKAKALYPHLGAILITAFGEINLAVQAMKDGADDFLTKPITDLDELEMRVAKAVKTNTLEKQVEDLKSELDKHANPKSFTGNSETMQRIYALLRKVAPTNVNVLITGPSGTGKELAARAVHQLSKRASGPFVAVECAAFAGDLLASELFGYEPGTFTGGLKDGKAGCFESANGGTIFLDEIGEIDMPTQIALLRVLETHAVRRLGGAKETPVDFRLVTATNKNLTEMVRAGTFREDLYYRLNVVEIKMPALREHKEDIALLAARFLKESARKNGCGVRGIEAAAMKALEDYDWPGNVRQLRNVIEKMTVLATGERLTQQDVPLELTQTPIVKAPPKSDPITAASVSDDEGTLADAEKRQILAAIEKCGGNKSKAAMELGISRRTLHRKINSWNANGL